MEILKWNAYPLVAVVILLLASCKDKDETIAHGFVFDSTETNNLVPVVGAEVKAAVIGSGGGLFSGKTYATTYTDNTGKFWIKFEPVGKGTTDLIVKKEGLYGGTKQDAVINRQENYVELYMYAQ